MLFCGLNKWLFSLLKCLLSNEKSHFSNVKRLFRRLKCLLILGIWLR